MQLHEPDVDALQNDLTALKPDDPSAVAKWAAVHRFFAEESINIPLAFVPDLIAWSTKVSGFKRSMMGLPGTTGVRFDQLRLKSN